MGTSAAGISLLRRAEAPSIRHAYKTERALRRRSSAGWTTTFYYDGRIQGYGRDSPKTFAAIGPNIHHPADKKYYNTVTADFGI